MAATSPAGFDAHQLKAEIKAIYAAVARDPSGDFHFHRGPEFAAEFLGYDKERLDTLPSTATASFAGRREPSSHW